jgi:hypothetical protein
MIDEQTKRKRAEEGQKAMHDYLADARAVDEKTAKLRALRLAREAEAVKAKKASAKPKRGRAIPVEELTAANDK